MYIETPPIAIPGCMDIDANNYNALATVDDGSCIYTPPVSGCMNPNATNFNPLAVVDDGSCILTVYMHPVYYMLSVNIRYHIGIHKV